jgi:adenosylcobinamide-GDP ribazoletransferase
MPPLVYETVAWLRSYCCLPMPPLPGETEVAAAADPARNAYAAPIAGAIIGAIGGLALIVAWRLGASPFVAAALSLMTLVAITCGQAERALAASAEKLGGGALDAPVGTRLMGYGIVAIIVAVLIRVGTIEGLALHGIWRAAFALVAAGAVARAMALAFALMRPAGIDGVPPAAVVTDKTASQWLALSGLGIGLLATVPGLGIAAAVAGVAAAAGAVALVTAFVPRSTGDGRQFIGTAELVAEIAFLLAALAFANAA